MSEGEESPEQRRYTMPRIGEVIADKYRLEKVAGEGGMGIVYAAEHLVLKQRVAVKVLLPDAASSEAIVERFAREARAAARINSEHVARVLDAGSLASGAPFLVMEYLEGCDLEELLALQRTLPVGEVADYLVQALEGLAHAHAACIVHRDLKPANLFLGCRPDGTNAIKLLDFGISKSTRVKPEDKRLTGHHVLGSPVYMSPEQLRNAQDIDARADIWSIGIVGYELLAGVPPFDADGVGEIFAAILEKEPIPLHEKNPKIPVELSDIIQKCLRRDPAERWSNTVELAKVLAPFGTDPQASAAVVERAEQVLARAASLKTPQTPLETRRVVEAIEAAAERAMTSSKSFPAIPLAKLKERARASRGKGTRSKTLEDGAMTRLVLFARRSPMRAIGAAGMLVLVLGLCTFGAIRATRTSSAAVTSNAASPTTHPTNAKGEGTAPPNDPNADGDGDDAVPLVMDLPSNPNDKSAPNQSRRTKSGKPQRPKFLNTRE